METVKQMVEWAAAGVGIFTVFIIVAAGALGTLHFLINEHRRVPDACLQYKVHLGKMLIPALEYLVAANIIRTIALEQTIQNIAILGVLVPAQTFLNWSLTFGVECRWPWFKTPNVVIGEAAE